MNTNTATNPSSGPAVYKKSGKKLIRMPGRPMTTKEAGKWAAGLAATGGIVGGAVARMSGGGSPVPVYQGPPIPMEQPMTLENVPFKVFEPSLEHELRLDMLHNLKFIKNIIDSNDTQQLIGIDCGGSGKSASTQILSQVPNLKIIKIDKNNFCKAVKNTNNIYEAYLTLLEKLMLREDFKYTKYVIIYIDEITDAKSFHRKMFTEHTKEVKESIKGKNKNGDEYAVHFALFGNFVNDDKGEAQYKGFRYKDRINGKFVLPHSEKGWADRRLQRIDGFNPWETMMGNLLSYLTTRFIQQYNDKTPLRTVVFDSGTFSGLPMIIQDEIKNYTFNPEQRPVSVGDWVACGGERILFDIMHGTEIHKSFGRLKPFTYTYMRRIINNLILRIKNTTEGKDKKLLQKLLFTISGLAQQINNKAITMDNFQQNLENKKKINNQYKAKLILPPWLKNDPFSFKVEKQQMGNKYEIVTKKGRMPPEQFIEDMEIFIKGLSKSTLQKSSLLNSKVSAKNNHKKPKNHKNPQKILKKSKTANPTYLNNYNKNLAKKQTSLNLDPKK
jgi:hypothetical protein